jgi:hypothetical protein
MKMENEKVKNAPPPIPGYLSYCITKKVITKKVIPKKHRYDNVYTDNTFADFLWCIKVRSKDITRPDINRILIEPTKIIATDGHRMHIITNPYPSIPPGEYEVYGINQSKIILIAKPGKLFPHWNKPSITQEGKSPKHEITISNPVYFYTEILKHQLFNIKYLQDAISNDPMGVRIYGENQPIIITTNTRMVIVMPLLDKKQYVVDRVIHMCET